MDVEKVEETPPAQNVPEDNNQGENAPVQE